jgi:hypothetical protein
VFVEEENIVCTLIWPSLTPKIGKKSLFYEEKSLVGLTPGQCKSSLMLIEVRNRHSI